MVQEILHCSCGRVAKYMICKVERKTKGRLKAGKLLPVCGTCDSRIGIQNLETQGCTRKEAVEINRSVKGRHKVKEIKEVTNG